MQRKEGKENLGINHLIFGHFSCEFISAAMLQGQCYFPILFLNYDTALFNWLTKYYNLKYNK